MTDQPPITETFEQIKTYIQEANDIIARGEIIELQGLDARVKTMCDAVAAMETDEAAAHKEEMLQLMGELEKLQSLLLNNRNQLQGDLEGVQTHSAASHAYSKSGALAPKQES